GIVRPGRGRSMDQSTDIGSGARIRHRRARRLWLLVVALHLVIAGGVFWASREPVSPEQLAAQLPTQAPAGSTHEQLQGWLKQQGFDCYPERDYVAAPFPFSGKTLAQLA